MGKFIRRTPKGYDGTGVTTHKMSDLLPGFLSQIGEAYKDRPDLILASWPEVIGERLAPMTQAMAFVDGVLTVKVKNSSLHALLSQNDKHRILNSLKKKFPKAEIRNIVFRIG